MAIAQKPAAERTIHSGSDSSLAAEMKRLNIVKAVVSGGTGVLGRALRPLAATASHELVMFPKAGRIRFSAFLHVPYSEGRCCVAPRCRTLERDLAM